MGPVLTSLGQGLGLKMRMLMEPVLTSARDVEDSRLLQNPRISSKTSFSLDVFPFHQDNLIYCHFIALLVHADLAIRPIPTRSAVLPRGWITRILCVYFSPVDDIL
jgi:hypothetical protein